MTERNTHNAPMTVNEVAAMHRVSRRTIERWIRGGKLPAGKLPGGLVRIEPSDAQALLTPLIPAESSEPEMSDDSADPRPASAIPDLADAGHPSSSAA